MQEAVFFDIDGTLISYETHTMPESTIRALNQLREKGVKLFVATGRPKMMMKFLDEYFLFDAYISLNGQYCYNETEVIYKRAIPQKALRKLLAIMDKQPFACTFIEENEMYANYIDDLVVEHCNVTNQPLPPVKPIENIFENDILQFIAFIQTEEEGKCLKKLPLLSVSRTLRVSYDVMPSGGGKVCGIEAVLAYYGIDKKDIMAFGDGENDADMLSYAGLGIAMGNATLSAKKSADYVTDNIDQDGIMKALIHFGMIDEGFLCKSK